MLSRATLSISGGQTFFGFTSGETYTMTVVGGENQTEIVRSTSGKPPGNCLTVPVSAASRDWFSFRGAAPVSLGD